MITTTRALRAGAIAAVVLPTLIGGVALSAHAASPASTSAPSTSAALQGLVIAQSTQADVPNGQSRAVATCPSGLKVLGGGALVSSDNLTENISSSTPLLDGSGWVVYIVDSASSSSNFTVYATCAKKPKKYVIVQTAGSAAVVNPAGQQTTVTIACPTGTVPLGGGGTNGSGHNGLGLATNSSLPTSNGWRFDQNNADTLHGDNTIYADAVCAKKPAGYAVVPGAGSAYGASTQGGDTASCPAGKKVVGGGALSSSSSTTVDLNSTYPSGQAAWRSYIDDTGSVASTVTSYAVCVTA